MSPVPTSLHTEHLAGLLARVRDGDRSAGDELIRRTSERLVYLARRMLRRFPLVRSQEETGDVVQDVVLRLLAALREHTPCDTRTFYGLASQHIRFHLLDLARKCRRGVPRQLEGQQEPIASGTGPGEASEFACWQALHEAVEGLPAEQRELFGLRFYHGWTWADIAALLQVNERTARRCWVRAGLALGGTLGGWVPGEE